MSKLPYFIHESSFVAEDVVVGEGTKIWHCCNIMRGTKIGARTVVAHCVFIGTNVIIGNNVKVHNFVNMGEGAIIEDDVFLAPHVCLTNVTNPRSFISRRSEFATTLIKRGATIGSNSTIVCGVTVDRYAFVGAGSVVTKDVPAYALVYGNPSRLMGWVCSCGVKLKFNEDLIPPSATCRTCGKRYVKRAKRVEEITEEGYESAVNRP